MKVSVTAESSNKRRKKETATSTNLIQLMRQRQTIYAFLKRVYEKELSREFLRAMPPKMKPLLALADSLPNSESQDAVRQLVKFTNAIPSQNIDELWTKLAADYARLFLSIHKTPAHPSESVYRDGVMMQFSRDEVLSTYWSFGIDKKTEFTEPEDHIAIELGFMMFLSEKAHQALQKGRTTEASKYIQSQQDFLEQHLLKWVPKLVDDIITAGRTQFYKSIALLTKEFLEMDVFATKDILKELKD